MEEQDLNQVAFNVAAYLHEGNETRALALYMTSEIEFIPAHDYTTETGWNGREPDTFLLLGSRPLFEEFKEASETAKQIERAFEATFPDYHVAKVQYRPVRNPNQAWKEQLQRELPAATAVEAEFKDEV